ncbi:hypothetical protein F5Y18DRAFT_421964 [Xylariaceae sp. FL1019]|nr:hypothetical protein F5Y18DRAFT_421964 [Xylariaceae sp. FL1019]
MSGGDGIFTYRHGIAVAQLVLYTVSLAFAAYFKYAHRNGWFCIGVFSIFRIIGAGCMLGTITNDADSVWQENKVTITPTIDERYFWYPQLLTWADIGLAIGGFVAASQNEHGLDPTPYTQASFGLFTALYLIVVYICWCIWRARANFPLDERLLVRSAVVCLPLLAVRLAYALVYQITGDRTFNAVKGNSTAYLFFVFFPELALIYVAILAIMKVNPPEQNLEGVGQRRQQWTNRYTQLPFLSRSPRTGKPVEDV